MKKTLLILSIFTSAVSFAQTTIPLTKGKQIKITTVTNQNIDMGMQMSTTSTMVNKIDVLNVDAKNYTLGNTLTKFLFNGNMLGKETTYDSDKAEDRTTEEGKQFSQMLDKTDTVLVDVETGTAIKDDIQKVDVSEADNPMSSMMSGMSAGSGNAVAGSILFKIPGAVAKGKTWTDSSTIENMKSIMVYAIEKIENGVATVSSKGSVKGTSSMELQGNSFDMTLNTKIDGTILVDTKSFLVQKRSNVADINGNIDMMGQSMPFTSKTTTESSYQ